MDQKTIDAGFDHLSTLISMLTVIIFHHDSYTAARISHAFKDSMNVGNLMQGIEICREAVEYADEIAPAPDGIADDIRAHLSKLGMMVSLADALDELADADKVTSLH